MKKVLCLFAHPNSTRSRANKRILQSVGGLPGLTIRSLYDLYPEFYIDVKAEQKLLAEHEVLYIQHPFYWYSMPPLLKLWFDTVLEYDWAYGPKGRALVGKDFFLSITAGGPLDSYRAEGYNSFPIEAFWPPYEQTARLCGMRWHSPEVLHHSTRVGEEALLRHAEKVRDRVSALAMGEDS
jgi:glutathione-regulated potassium-efflux system ancillary protein KefG